MYLLVVNAANKDKDFEHVKSFVPKDVIVEDVSHDYGLIAIQGPESAKFVKELLGEYNLNPLTLNHET